MRNRYRNVAFLAELLINILVFSVSCAVLVGLFGKAGQLARQTKEQGLAAGEVQSLVETLKASGAENLPDGRLACHYDADWQPQGADGEEAAYIIYIDIIPEETGAGVLSHLSAWAVDRDGAEVYRLETATYQPGTGGEAP